MYRVLKNPQDPIEDLELFQNLIFGANGLLIVFAAPFSTFMIRNPVLSAIAIGGPTITVVCLFVFRDHDPHHVIAKK